MLKKDLILEKKSLEELLLPLTEQGIDIKYSIGLGSQISIDNIDTWTVDENRMIVMKINYSKSSLEIKEDLAIISYKLKPFDYIVIYSDIYNDSVYIAKNIAVFASFSNVDSLECILKLKNNI